MKPLEVKSCADPLGVDSVSVYTSSSSQDAEKLDTKKEDQSSKTKFSFEDATASSEAKEELFESISTEDQEAVVGRPEAKKAAGGYVNPPVFLQAFVHRDTVAQRVYDLRSKDSDVVNNALVGLNSMCDKDRRSGERQREMTEIVEMGGCVAIVNVLEQWNTDELIQAQACRTLRSLVSKCRHRAVNLGAIEYVLTAMKNFPDSADVQRSACGALLNIVKASSLGTERFVSDNGATTLVQAMQLFPLDAKLQELSCRMLCHLCTSSKEANGILINVGATTATASAIEKHNSNKAVMEPARNAMKLLINTLHRSHHLKLAMGMSK